VRSRRRILDDEPVGVASDRDRSVSGHLGSALRRLRSVKLPKAFLLTLLGVAITAWLIPALTRQWQDQQRARELKASVVTRISRDTTDALILSSAITNGRFQKLVSGEAPRVPRKLFNDLDLSWERNRREIEAQLLAYFPGAVRDWRAYSQLVRSTYWLITNRKRGRTDTVRNLKQVLPPTLHRNVDRLEEPYWNVPDFAPRHAYFFVSRGLLQEKSAITNEILRADPVSLSTDTSDFFQDLLPFI